MDLSVVSAASIWYLSVGAIVVGHVIAVYLAHVMALRAYRDPRVALRSQIPMLVLMVFYWPTPIASHRHESMSTRRSRFASIAGALALERTCRRDAITSRSASSCVIARWPRPRRGAAR